MKINHKVDDIDFEWDEEKADKNFEKHGISFPEASEVFFDPFALPAEQREENGEIRNGVIGLTRKWNMLFVAYVWRKLVIRLISARKVTKAERKKYENQ